MTNENMSGSNDWDSVLSRWRVHDRQITAPEALVDDAMDRIIRRQRRRSALFYAACAASLVAVAAIGWIQQWPMKDTQNGYVPSNAALEDLNVAGSSGPCSANGSCLDLATRMSVDSNATFPDDQHRFDDYLGPMPL